MLPMLTTVDFVDSSMAGDLNELRERVGVLEQKMNGVAALIESKGARC